MKRLIVGGVLAVIHLLVLPAAMRVVSVPGAFTRTEMLFFLGNIVVGLVVVALALSGVRSMLRSDRQRLSDLRRALDNNERNLSYLEKEISQERHRYMKTDIRQRLPRVK